MVGYDPMASKRKSPFQTSGAELHNARTRQAAKLRALREALVSAGSVTVKEQAEVLGLSRSTTWTIMRGSHKGSGLSAAVINRILDQRLPPRVRLEVIDYIERKAAGDYGHSRLKRQKFVARLSTKHIDLAHLHRITQNQAA
jgi:hypothetical protein